jgi:hypothetical protein
MIKEGDDWVLDYWVENGLYTYEKANHYLNNTTPYENSIQNS